MFGNLSERLVETFKNLRTKGKLSAADIDATLREIRRALLEADVALEVVKAFTGAVRERAMGDEVSKALNPAQQVVQIVNEELVKILGGEQRKLEFSKKPPTVIMLAGLQGSGKTTLAGKLAKWLKDQNQTPLLVAADLQRPNAVNQLQVVGERAGVDVFAPETGNGKGDPVKVSKDAIKYAEKKQYSVVIVDTAGRLGVDEELMKQARDIRKATDPDEVLFVIDSMMPPCSSSSGGPAMMARRTLRELVIDGAGAREEEADLDLDLNLDLDRYTDGIGKALASHFRRRCCRIVPVVLTAQPG